MTPATPLQLVCTDFDGTIHLDRENPPVGKEFQDLIGELQAAGVRWVINTGRDLSSLLEEMARARMTVRPDFIVVVEREIHIHEHSRYVSHAHWNDRCTAVHAELFARLRPELPPLFEWVNEHFEASVFEDPWSPFCLVASNLDESLAIVRRCEEWAAKWPEVAVVRNDVYARLSHVDFNKGTALQEVARLIDVSPEGILVAGDHVNDLPMLDRSVARWLVAPDNCVPEVRSHVRTKGGWLMEGRGSQGVTEGLRRCLAERQPID